MNMFLQIQFQSGVKRNAVWNDLRGSEQVDAMDVWFSVSLQMRARERTFTHIGTCGEEKNKTKGMATSFPLCFTATPSIAVIDDRHVWKLVDSHGLLFPPPFPMFGVNSAAQPKKNPTLPPVLLCGQLSLQSCAESFSTCFSDCLAS